MRAGWYLLIFRESTHHLFCTILINTLAPCPFTIHLPLHTSSILPALLCTCCPRPPCPQAAAEATEADHKSLLRSTIPLGKTGINLVEPAQWQSEQQEHYVPHKVGGGLKGQMAD